MRVKKYELVKEKKEKLYRLKSLIHIPRYAVNVGDLGGYVEGEYSLSHSGDAWISGSARVTERAKIIGDALVSGSARISGDALITDNAQILESVTISGNAMISGNAWLSGNALIDNASVSGAAWVYGHAWVMSNSVVSGSTKILGDARIINNARITGVGDIKISGNTQISYDALVASKEDYITIGPIGLRDDYTVTAYRTLTGSFLITRGCFTGSLKEFQREISHVHGERSIYWEVCTAACEVFEKYFRY